MYCEAAPGPRLSAFVERLCFSSDDAPGAPPAVRVVPDGAVDLLFSAAAAGGACSAELFGLKTRALLVATPDSRDNVLLRLRPGAVARLFGVAAHELTDRALPLRELVGAPADAWRERVAGARSPAERRAVLERELGGWCARRARAEDAEHALAERAAAALRRSSGARRIAALAESLGVGERRLERVFRARIGVTPKRFAAILRFAAAYRALAAGAGPLAAALAHGYFDQAHLNRDFRRLAGAPPRRIFPSPR
ncbi:MAG TPA: helix-turn-helix domain-containing protein [Myxococcota bacterium]|nr:helix-turn-helix domain-containing protein [Myxococcota bacterium]